MKSITESIKLNEADNIQWEVLKSINNAIPISKFAAPDKQYLWIYRRGQVMSFVGLEDIKNSFENFDMMDCLPEIKALKIGESWCESEDDFSIYVRLY